MAWSQISVLQQETSQQWKYLERIYVTRSLFWLLSGTGMLDAIVSFQFHFACFENDYSLCQKA